MNQTTLLRSIISTALAILLNGCCCNNGSKAKLQRILNDQNNHDAYGILAGIYSPNHIDWHGSTGYKAMDKKKELKPSDLFRIASVTKTFTAASILRLWEENRIGLDTPITQYISEQHTSILTMGGYNPHKITVRHLLTHRGGLSDHTHSPKFDVEFLKKRHIWSREEQINDLVTYGQPLGKPGEQFGYSDTGYILLAEIIEKITQQPFGSAMAELLQFKKTGLTCTQLEHPDGDFSGKRIHQYINGIDTYDFHPSFDYFGGGGLLSNTKELCKFYYALFNHEIFLNRSTLDTMITPVGYYREEELDYRMGIWKTSINGLEGFTHTGFWGTQVVFFPKINTAITVNYSQRWKNKGNAPLIKELLETLLLEQPQHIIQNNNN